MHARLAQVGRCSLADSSMFLPPVISCAATITAVQVSTAFEGALPVFSYQVKWVEKEEEPPLVKKTSSMLRVSGNVRCEGPCGQSVPISSTVQYGCDHAVCEKCRKTAECTTLFDGSPGCCNKNCVAVAKENGEKVCVGQSDSAQTLISQSGVIESIQCHVVILKASGSNGVQRLNQNLEFPSSTRLSKLLVSLSEYKELIAKSRFYYSLEKPTKRTDCLPISLMDTHLRFHDLIDMKNSQEIYFMIVGPDVFFQ